MENITREIWEQLLNGDHTFLSAGKKEQCSRAYGKEQAVGSMLSAGTSNTELIQAKKTLYNYWEQEGGDGKGSQRNAASLMIWASDPQVCT